MKLELTINQQKQFKEILEYFLQIKTKLWKRFVELLPQINSIYLKLNQNELILTEAEKLALIEFLEFFLYSPLPNCNLTESSYFEMAETILFKRLKHRRFNLITLQFEVYNENTNRFESTQNNTTK
jgi:hypothetical protein